MKDPTPEVVKAWLKAAGKEPGITGLVLDQVLKVGNFVRQNSRYSASTILNVISGFDFSRDVKQVPLNPNKLYVHYQKGPPGNWYTTTGLSQDDVGLADGFRTRELYHPSGNVQALKGIAKSIRDKWSADDLFKFAELDKKWDELQAKATAEGRTLTISMREALKSRLGSLTRGGGVQFWVLHPENMVQFHGKEK